MEGWDRNEGETQEGRIDGEGEEGGAKQGASDEEFKPQVKRDTSSNPQLCVLQEWHNWAITIFHICLESL